MKTFHIAVISLSLLMQAVNANAQIQIIEKTIAKIEACKSIAYDAASESNNPFSNELYDTEAKISFSRQTDTVKLPAYNIYTQTKSSGGFNNSSSDIFNQKDLLSINYTDKTYKIKKDYNQFFNYDYSIYVLLNQLKNNLKSADFDIIALKDSVLNNRDCYHITIKTKDSVAQKTNSYENTELLIGKADDLPVFWKTNKQGVMEKGGMKVGVIKLSSATYATNFKLNSVNANVFSLKNPTGFKEEKPPLPLLSAGTPAPDWQLTDTEDKKITMASLKGKIVLLDITSTSCPACVLSVVPLNNLHEKFKGTDVVIVSVNLDDTKKTILNFKNKNKVNYPIYVNGSVIKAKYHVSAIPTFYIVDKDGIIRKAYDGFFERFEEKVSATIQKLM